MIQMVPPHPTSNRSMVLLLLSCCCFRLSAAGESTASRDSPAFSSGSTACSSIHSARPLHTLAMVSHSSVWGLSIWPMRFQASSASALSRCSFVRMILMPCSFSQTTYRPDSDHLIVFIVPSPECRTVSLPLLAPTMLPSQPAACAVAPVVMAVLLPVGAPTVRMSCPERPPDKYILSCLYSGERATACTGRAKFRNCTSLTSIKDWTQTLPSIDDVAM